MSPAPPTDTIPCHTIRYLTAEQRLNYLVEIDPQGLLRWTRNGEPVDTAPNKWKNAQGGMGIVPIDSTEFRDTDQRLQRKASTSDGGAGRNSLTEEIGSDARNSAEPAQHKDRPKENKLMQATAGWLSMRGLKERLLRKAVNKNTWIFVSVCGVLSFCRRFLHLPSGYGSFGMPS